MFSPQPKMRDVFAVEIAETDRGSSDDVTTKLHTTIIESRRTTNAENQTVVDIENNDNSEQFKRTQSMHNSSTQVPTNACGNTSKRHKLKIAIVDMHKMAYDPHSSPRHLPSYEDYVK